MILIKKEITKFFYGPVLNYIKQELEESICVNSTKDIGVYLRAESNDELLLFAFDGHKGAIGFLWLGKPNPAFQSYEVKLVWVREDFRGQGIGEMLYETAVNRLDILIISGKLQTEKSKALWERFVYNGTDVYAVDLKNVRRSAHVFWADDELQFSGNIENIWVKEGTVLSYNEQEGKEDIRLCLQKLRPSKRW
jgi:GNAT superfamily N-acetyltransferase